MRSQFCSWAWGVTLAVTLAVSATAAAALATTTSTDAAPTGAVTRAAPPRLIPLLVGEQPVSELELRAAVELCRSSDPSSPIATCLSAAPAWPWLLDRAAFDRKIGELPRARRQRDQILSEALLSRIIQDAPPPSPADIERAEAQMSSELTKPERIRIWRILVSTEPEARKVRSQLGSVVTPAAFRALAREASLDKATHERGGDLGFVAPDGSTDVPEVSADPALYDAAKQLVDGQLAQEPVAEQGRFAVIWRRGTLPAARLDDDDARELVASSLQRERADLETKRLLAELSQRHLKDWHPERLELLRGSGRMFPLR